MENGLTPAGVLVVDDEESVCWTLARAMGRAGYAVWSASSAERGLALAREHRPAVVLLDVRLPKMDGIDALDLLRRDVPEAAVIVMTAHGDLSTAVRAVEGGAFDYLPKPFDLTQVESAVARALEVRPPVVEQLTPSNELMIGRSAAMQAVFKRIALAAPSSANILIQGESGTGKELVARAIHRYSPRRDKAFVPVHVAALNPQLVESELFGHVRGAFTGAEKARPGLLELADGGTAFLDELADIPPAVQAKLLRVLEYQELLPVGGSEAKKIDVRLVSATHRDLRAAVAAGEFRQDLYFRLNTFEIRVPPLRERPDDLPELARHFLATFGQSCALGDETLEWLRSRPWPGNVRELRNALEHAAIVARQGGDLARAFSQGARRGPAAGIGAGRGRRALAGRQARGRIGRRVVRRNSGRGRDGVGAEVVRLHGRESARGGEGVGAGTGHAAEDGPRAFGRNRARRMRRK